LLKMSNHPWRSYNSPTCTLELFHKIPQWPMGNIDRSNRRFRLRLLAEDATTTTNTAETNESEAENIWEIDGNFQQLEALRQATNTYLQDLLKTTPESYNATLLAGVTAATTSQETTATTTDQSQPPSPTTTSSSTPTTIQPSPTSDNIYLESQAGLRHQLHLGTLATETTGESISLSTLQLFDLAAACDRYASDKQQRAQIPIHPTNLKAVPQWARMVALLVVTAGVTATVMETLERRSQSSQEVASTPDKTTVSPNPTVPSPTPSFPSNIEEVPLPPDRELSDQERLSMQQQSSPEATSSPSPSATTNNTSETDDGSTPPPPPSEARSTLPPPRTGNDQSLSRDVPTTPISPLPNDSTNRRSQPMSTPTPSATSENPLQEAPGNQQNGATTTNRDGSQTALAPSPNSSGEEGTTNEQTTTKTANLAQVREAQEHFQSQWQGNPDLEERLQYRLLLNPDGTVKYIRPLSNTSGQYIDRTGMPLMGESLVSSLPSGEEMRIRVVLEPDGEVKVFSE
jgi:hypothetical protein